MLHASLTPTVFELQTYILLLFLSHSFFEALNVRRVCLRVQHADDSYNQTNRVGLFSLLGLRRRHVMSHCPFLSFTLRSPSPSTILLCLGKAIRTEWTGVIPVEGGSLKTFHILQVLKSWRCAPRNRTGQFFPGY